MTAARRIRFPGGINTQTTRSRCSCRARRNMTRWATSGTTTSSGMDTRRPRRSGRMKKASILPIAERGIVGRGVLLDMAAYRGKFALEKGDTLDLDDLLGAAKKQGVTIEKHDILCLRIGFLQLLHTQAREVLRQLQRTGPDLQPRARGLVPQDGDPRALHRHHLQRDGFRSRDRHAGDAALRADAQPWRRLQRDLQLRGACEGLPRRRPVGLPLCRRATQGAPRRLARPSTSSRSSNDFRKFAGR